MYKTPFMASNGIVASEHPLASLAGLKVLMNNGNAIDATIATSFALSVLQPHLGGLGSDFFALIYSSDDGKVYCINSSGWAPTELKLEILRNKGFSMMPKKGPLTVVVPGLVAGLNELHKKFGSLDFEKLLSDAIKYAEKGFPVYRGLSIAIKTLKEELKHDRGFREIFLKNGSAPEIGEFLVQRKLAATLRLIAEEGPDSFYKGDIAESIVEYTNSLGGVFSINDFKDYLPEWTEPIYTTYRGVTVYEVPPNTMGPTTLMMLNMLEKFEINKFPPSSPQRVILHTELAKIAYEERNKKIGDPRFVDVPLNDFISKDYATELIKKKLSRDIRIKLYGGDTTYFTITDEEGNIVSAIQSLFYPFGSGLVDPNTGVPLNGRASYFKFSGPNVVAPRKRPVHTLSSLLLERDGEIFAALGTSGGEFRPQQHTLLVSNLIDYGMPLWGAIEFPRFLWDGERILIEQGIEKPTSYKIQQLSYPGRTGVAQGIFVSNGKLKIGVCDLRGDGLPMGY
ncbi:MAG: gamma-glutamyltransferase family protein [Candidatus Asgardarchaeia archaeon]